MSLYKSLTKKAQRIGETMIARSAVTRRFHWMNPQWGPKGQ